MKQCQKICLPFTLPKVGNITMPVCKNKACYSIASSILAKLNRDMDKLCKISCNVKEYRFGEGERVRGESVNRSSMLFEYEFDSPSSTNSNRFRVPLKVVKTEYEVFPFISLVGVVGGTLGMFVGMSFMGIAEQLISAVSVKIHSSTDASE